MRSPLSTVMTSTFSRASDARLAAAWAVKMRNAVVRTARCFIGEFPDCYRGAAVVPDSTTPATRLDLEVQLEVDVIDISASPDRVRHGGVADGNVIEAQPFAIDADAAHALGEIVDPAAQLRRIAEVAAYLRVSRVHLQQLRDQHGGRLDLVAVVGDVVDHFSAGTAEVGQPPPVELGLECHAAILDACVHARHLVQNVIDRDAWP